MKSVLITFSGLLAVATASVFLPAPTLVRSPQHDSAIIQTERVGNSFSYSTVEGHAYQAISPVLAQVYSPVGVRYEYRAYPSYFPAAAYNYPYYVQQPLYTQILTAPVAPEAPAEAAAQDETSESASDEPEPANDSPAQSDDDTVAIDSE